MIRKYSTRQQNHYLTFYSFNLQSKHVTRLVKVFSIQDINFYHLILYRNNSTKVRRIDTIGRGGISPLAILPRRLYEFYSTRLE
jgi:hypothetical protein